MSSKFLRIAIKLTLEQACHTDIGGLQSIKDDGAAEVVSKAYEGDKRSRLGNVYSKIDSAYAVVAGQITTFSRATCAYMDAV